MIHILAGEARLELGGDVKAAHPGSTAYLPPGLRHAIFAQTQVVMLLELIKQP